MIACELFSTIPATNTPLSTLKLEAIADVVPVVYNLQPTYPALCCCCLIQEYIGAACILKALQQETVPACSCSRTICCVWIPFQMVLGTRMSDMPPNGMNTWYELVAPKHALLPYIVSSVILQMHNLSNPVTTISGASLLLCYVGSPC